MLRNLTSLIPLKALLQGYLVAQPALRPLSRQLESWSCAGLLPATAQTVSSTPYTNLPDCTVAQVDRFRRPQSLASPCLRDYQAQSTQNRILTTRSRFLHSFDLATAMSQPPGGLRLGSHLFD